jgi:Na+/phosphate symporter
MIDEFITKVGNAIRDTLGSWFSLSWIPEIFFWYWWLFLLAMVCGVIIFFFGWSKIVRIVASMTFLIAAVFVAGGHVMARRMNAKQAAQKVKEQKRQQQQRVETQQPWRWPWEQG